MTAHRAQGATVDRAFVLGPRSSTANGATPRSRATGERTLLRERTPAFLNRSTVPLSAAADTTHEVTRTLSASRAQRLALDGLAPDPMRGLLEDELNHARGELTAIDARLSDLERERHRTHWYERAARRELERRIENWERPRAHWLSEAEQPSAC